MSKKRTKYKVNKLRFFVFLLLFTALFFLFKPAAGWYFSVRYPVKYSEIVEKYSAEINIDKYLIYAVINTESGFDEKAVSHKGAQGLMQIMEDTAIWCMDKMNLEASSIIDPDVNIHIGTWYLKMLLDKYDGDVKTALAAYNGGMGNVSRWLNDPEYSNSEGRLTKIPFAETRKYVRNVLWTVKIYKNKL